jgi:hypothetical protein
LQFQTDSVHRQPTPPGWGNAFCLRHQLLRRAVRDMIPQAGQTALHRQYGQLLLGQGERAVQAAGHLLQAVRPGDQTGRLADGRA